MKELEPLLITCFRLTKSRISCSVTRSAARSQLEIDIATEILANLPSTISETLQQRRDSFVASSTESWAEVLEPMDECNVAIRQIMELWRLGSHSSWATHSAPFNSSIARNGLPKTRSTGVNNKYVPTNGKKIHN